MHIAEIRGGANWTLQEATAFCTHFEKGKLCLTSEIKKNDFISLPIDDFPAEPKDDLSSSFQMTPIVLYTAILCFFAFLTIVSCFIHLCRSCRRAPQTINPEVPDKKFTTVSAQTDESLGYFVPNRFEVLDQVREATRFDRVITPRKYQQTDDGVAAKRRSFFSDN